jgi:hypothetical protein
MLPTIGTPPPADAPLAVEELMERRDTTGTYEKFLKRREEFMQEDEDLVRPRLRPEQLDKGIAGLRRSLRPELRPEEEIVDPPYRYPGTNTGIGKGYDVAI